MLLDSILIVITLIVLFIASYVDLKSREVPDWLSYAFVFAVLGIRFIFAVEQGWNIFWSGTVGFMVLFGLGYLFYWSSLWGGGDAKLLMGLGAAIGLPLPFSASSLNLVWFFLLVLCIGAIYGLVWLSYLAWLKKDLLFGQFKKLVSQYKNMHFVLLILTLFVLILTIVNVLFWPLIFFPLGIFYLLLFVSLVEKSSFLQKVPLSSLTEGDWLAQEVKLKNQTIPRKTVSSKDLAFLQKSLPPSTLIFIKVGIPFTPSFLFSYIAFLFGPQFVPYLLSWVY